MLLGKVIAVLSVSSIERPLLDKNDWLEDLFTKDEAKFWKDDDILRIPFCSFS